MFDKIKVLILLGLFFFTATPAFPFGEGVYLKINTSEPLSIAVDSSNCVDIVDDIVPNKKIYLKSNIISYGECYVNFSLFSMDRTKIASYMLKISADASSLSNTFSTDSHIKTGMLYPRYGYYPVDSQGFAIISVASDDTSAWMGSLVNKIRDKKLNQIFIPGTHDSGTYLISAQSPLMPDAKSSIVNAVSYGGNLGSNVVASWAKTQENHLLAQLNSGIRYFDLRLCGTSTAIEDVYACHAFQGDSLKNMVKAVKKFLQKGGHEHELIILDINHWYNTNDNDLLVMQKNVLNFISAELSPWIAPRRNQDGADTYTPLTKISAFWNDKKQVIIASTPLGASGFEYVWTSVNTDKLYDCASPGTDLCSYWPNQQDAIQLQRSITSTLQVLRDSSHDYLFVLQLQLTPSSSTIGAGITGGSSNNLLSLTGTYKDNISTFLQGDEVFKDINGLIFIEDFSNGLDLTREVLRLNSR